MTVEHSSRVSRRRLIAVIGAAAAGTVLAACGQPAPAPTAAPATKPTEAPKAAAEPTKPAAAAPTSAPAAKPAASGAAVTIRHLPKVGGDDLKLVQAYAERFGKANPGITISVQPQAAGVTYVQQFLTDLAAGIPPDTVLTDDYLLAQWASRDAIVPLNDYMKAQTDLEPEDYFKSTFENCQWQGKTWGLPFYFFTLVLLYNKDMFDAAGLPTPPLDYNDKTWTFEKALEAAIKLTKKDSSGKVTQFGYLWDPAFLSRYSSHIYAWGGGARLVDDLATPTKSTLSEEGTVAALQWLQDVRIKHKAAPYPADVAALQATGNNAALLLNNALAMGVSGSWGLGSLKTGAKFNWGVAPLPRSNKDGKAGTAVATNAYALTTGSKAKDTGWKWLALIANKEYERERMKTVSNADGPGRASLVKDWLSMDSPEFRKVVSDAPLYGTTIIRFPSYLELQDAVTSNSEEIWLGTRPAAAVAKDIDTKVNALLAKK